MRSEKIVGTEAGLPMPAVLSAHSSLRVINAFKDSESERLTLLSR